MNSINHSRLLSEQHQSSNELMKYIKFMQKDIHQRNVAFPKAYRSSSITSLLDESICLCQFDPHKHHFIDVGNESQLVKAIRCKEKDILFKNEALIMTYPTSYLLKRYQRFCIDNLPKELANLTFGMLYGDNDDNEKVIDEVVLSDEDQKVSPQVRIALPTYADDISMQKKLKKEVIEIALATGYYFSSDKPWDYEANSIIKKPIRVFYMTFEAKYNYMDVVLQGNLYHVTSIRSLEKIKKYGLTTKMQSSEFSYPDRIFLFNDVPYKVVLDYGRDKASRKGDTKFCVLKILKASIDNFQLYKDGIMKFYRDPSFSDENSTSTEQKAIFTYSNIPIQLIEDDVLIYDIYDKTSYVQKLK